MLTRKVRILVADDQPDVRSALRLLLEQLAEAGVTVSEAWDANSLAAQVRAVCPDLVLLDWELVGLQAKERLSFLRANCSSLHVVVLSGLPEARQAALAAGADAFISKGDPPERVLDAVNSYCYKSLSN